MKAIPPGHQKQTLSKSIQVMGKSGGASSRKFQMQIIPDMDNLIPGTIHDLAQYMVKKLSNEAMDYEHWKITFGWVHQ